MDKLKKTISKNKPKKESVKLIPLDSSDSEGDLFQKKVELIPQDSDSEFSEVPLINNQALNQDMSD
jgi:hypothetical protein